MRTLAGGLLLCRLGLASVASADAQEPVTLHSYLRQAGYTPIRLEMDRDNHFFVQGSLHGKKQRFLLDTASGMTRLDPKLAQGFDKLDPAKLNREDQPSTNLQPAELVLMNEFELGGVKFTNQPAQVGKVSFEFASVAENGLLGRDFFVRNHCLIDCLRAWLYVRRESLPPDVEGDLEASLLRTGFSETRLYRKGQAPTLCRAKINGEAMELAVDMVSPWTVLDWDCAQRLKLALVAKPVHLDFSGMGKVGPHGLQESQIQTLQLGGASLKRVYLGVADLSAWRAASRANYQGEVQGVLGIDTLVVAGALFDFGTGKLWLNPPAPR